MSNTTRWRDADQREWVCHITIEKAIRIKQERGVDLLNPESIKTSFTDPLLVAELLADLHAEQWKDQMTLYEFAELAMKTEEVALSSSAALEAALTDFFRRLRRPALATVVEKAREATDRVEAAQIELLTGEKTTAAIDRLVADVIEKGSAEIDRIGNHGIASGKPPESSQ